MPNDSCDMCGCNSRNHTVICFEVDHLQVSREAVMPDQIDLRLSVWIWYVPGYLVTSIVTPDCATPLNRIVYPHMFSVTLRLFCATLDLLALLHLYETGIPEGNLLLSKSRSR